MKRILIFLVVLLPFLAKSQTVITGKYKYTDSLTFAKYKNNSTLDSVLSVDQNGRLRLAPRTGLDTTSLSNRIEARVKYTDTASMLIPYLRKLDTTGKWLAVGYLPYLVKYTDTAAFLSAYYNKGVIDSKLALKLNISDTANMLSPYVRTSNLPSLAPYVKYTDTASMLSSYYNKTATDAKLALKLNISDTANMLSSYYNKTATDSKLALKLNISDTANMLSPYARTLALGGYIPYTGATSAIDLNAKTVVNISHLGINTTTVPTILLRAIGDNNSSSRIAMRGYSSDANSSSIRVTKFRGTAASPQAPLSGDGLGKFELAGYGTTSSDGYPQASFEGIATENWGATARGAKVQIKITPNTTITQAVALTINQDKSAVFENSITGTSLIKTGGTSLQFLKADGSVDANSYMNISDTATMLSPYLRSTNYGLLKSGQTVSADSSLLSTKLWRQKGIDSVAALDAQKVKYTDTATMLSAYYNKTATDAKVNLKVNISDTATMLSAYYNKTATDSKFALKVNISDTAAMLSGYKTYYPRTALSFTAGSGAYNNSTGVITIPTNTNQLTNGAGFISSYTETDPVVKAINGIVKSNGTTISAATAGTDYQAPITLTTTGTSGAATLVGSTLNIPQYSGGGSITLSAIGSTPNANAATLTGSALNLEPASASFGGVVTTGTQTFAGIKIFNNNLGVGVTPSSWNTINNIQVNNASFAATSTQAFVGNNWFYQSGDKYISTASAGLFQINGNIFSWLQATSGTAGTAITFTTPMYLDASGNLGLGTTSIGASKFQVNGSAAIGYSASTAAPTNGLAVSGAVTIANSSSATYALDVTGAVRFSGQISTTTGIYINRASLPYIQFAQSGTTFGQVRGDGTTFGLTDANGSIYYLGLNASTGAATFTSSTTAASAVARGAIFQPTLVAAANNDVLSGVYINPTFTNGAFTGVVNAGLVVASGNVGIGTNSPSKPLTIVGGNTYSGTQLTISTPLDAAGIQLVAGTGGLSYEMQSSTTGQYFIYDRTNSAYRFVIANGGNVGIGTTTIGSKLQVNGNAAIGYSASTAAPTNGLVVAGSVGIGFTTTPNWKLEVKSTDNTSLGAANFQGVYSVTDYIAMRVSSGTTGYGAYTQYSDGTYNMAIGAATNGDFNFVSGRSPGTAGTERWRVTLSGENQLKPAANTIALSSSTYSLTGANAQSLLDLSGTWNTTGNPTAIKLNITNTASGSTSNLMDLQVGGVSKMSVDKAGNLTANNVTSGTYVPTLSASNNVTSSSVSTCQYMRVGNVVTVSGRISITATSALTLTSIRISLPITGNAFTSQDQAGGTGYFQNGSANATCKFYASNATLFTVDMQYYTGATTPLSDFYFSFTYQIL